MKAELKQILKHSLIYGAGTVLGKIIGFLMIPVYTRFLSPADYGIIELLDLTVYILGTLIGYSITSAIVRFYYDHKEASERKILVSTALLFVGGLSIAVALLLLPFSPLLSQLILKSPIYSVYFKIVLGTLCFQMIGEFCLTYTQVQQKSIQYTTYTLIKLFIGLGCNILFVVVLKKGPLGILYSSFISAFSLGLFLGIKTLFETKLHFSWEKLKAMLAYGYPLILGSLSTFVLTFSDRYFLNQYSTLTAVGIYALAYKLSMLIPVLVTGPFLTIWSAKRFEIAKLPDANEIQVKVFNYFAFILIFAAAALSIFVRAGLHLITTPDFFEAARFVPIIAIGYICNGLYYHFNFGIYFKNKTKYAAGILISGAVLDLVLNYFLIRRYHAMGAAIATSLAFFYIACATFFVSRRFYIIPYDIARLMKILLAGTTAYALALVFDPHSLYLSLAWKFFSLGTYPFLLLILGFYRLSELRELYQMGLRKLKGFNV